MAGVRDPAFWKRFSYAVHLDEEKGEKLGPQHDSDSWLARQQSKKKNRARVCWGFWIVFLLFVAAVVAVIIWLVESGVLSNIGHSGGDKMADASSS
ncbi:hypothetical protein WHR41_00232 [Cladosporium halotolerans]|uniref:Uncharacterized protein n=1 Tax=Cladosporium halotolerans TaxID=1052096 RepID=A0AB34L4A2_9PEZI